MLLNDLNNPILSNTSAKYLESFMSPPPPAKGEGDILVSVRIPLVSALASHFLYTRYLLKQRVEFHQTCMDILLGQA